MKTIIYFVRHGKVHNPKNIWYGRLPRFRLDDEGKKQIEQTANYFKNLNIDQIYSSHQLRAKQTAEIIRKKLNLSKVNFSKYLLEIKSSLQGSHFDYIKTLSYDVFAASHKENITGEAIEDVAARMKKFMHYIIKKHPGQKIIAVSHGDPLMLVKALLENLPIENASLRPGPENYIQHGEIYEVVCNETGPQNLKSIFKPKL